MSLLLIALGFVCMALFDVPRLIEQRQWKELTVYGALLARGGRLGDAARSDVPMPIIGSYITIVTRGLVSLFTGGGPDGVAARGSKGTDHRLRAVLPPARLRRAQNSNVSPTSST